MVKKAQAGLEYLMLVGILLAFMAAVLVYSMQTSTLSIRTTQARETVQTLAEASERLYKMGGGKATVTVTMPESVVNYTFSGDTIRLSIMIGDEPGDAIAFTSVNVTGALPRMSGRYEIPIVISGSKAVIGNILALVPSSISLTLTAGRANITVMNVTNNADIILQNLAANKTGSMSSFLNLSQPSSTLQPSGSSSFTANFTIPASRRAGTLSGSITVSNADFDASSSVIIVVINNPPTWSNLGANASSVHTNASVMFYSQWQDDSELDKFTLSWNTTSSCSAWVNVSGQSFLGQNWTNITRSIPNACEGRLVGFMFYANDTAGNENYTSSGALTVLNDMDFVASIDKNNNENVEIFANNGLGTFESSSVFDVSGNGRGIAIGDIDGDGDNDFVVGTTADDVILFTYGGSWSQATVDSSAGNNVLTVALGDSDNDSDLDIAAGTEGDKIFHYKNDGSWTRTTVDSDADGEVNYVIFANMTSDTNKDIVAGIQNKDINVYQGNGTGSFSLLTSLTTDNAVKVIKAADMDNDGDYDIVSGHGDNKARVFKNNGAGTLAEYYESSSLSADVKALDLGDLDGDGDTDAVAGTNNNKIEVFFNNATGGLGTSTTYSEPSNDINDVALSDLDDDGDLDIVAALNRDNTNNIYVYFNNGSGTFSSPAKYSTTNKNEIRGIAAGDLD